MTQADRPGEGNYLTILCLLDLIYDACCELVVIVDFGYISETGWGDVFDLASWSVRKEKFCAQCYSNALGGAQDVSGRVC